MYNNSRNIGVVHRRARSQYNNNVVHNIIIAQTLNNNIIIIRIYEYYKYNKRFRGDISI